MGGSLRAQFASVPRARALAVGAGAVVTATAAQAAACAPSGTAALLAPSSAAPPPPPAPPPAAGPPKILCLHGINLNMFGKRDPKVYGYDTLDDINAKLARLSEELGVQVECFQTNYEGEMAERIHRAHSDGTAAILINLGAWTHYSYGIRDALAILKVPIFEVHMSNIHAREDMAGSVGEQIRHHSVVSPLAKGIIAGFGLESYMLALRAAATATVAR